MRAEIIFTLWSIGQQHNLYSSSDGFAKVLAAMVPDSAIAKAFSLEKDKTRYMTQFGIAPIAKTLIIQDIGTDFFTVLFEESLNETVMSKQMDLIVRFWSTDSDGNHANVSRYIDSQFLGHPRLRG